VLVLGLSGFLLVFVTAWASQSYDATPKFIERYLVPLWPLYVVAALAGLGSIGIKAWTASAALVLLSIALLPGDYWRDDSQVVNVFDSPSGELGFALVLWLGTPLLVKALLAGQIALTMPWLRRLGLLGIVAVASTCIHRSLAVGRAFSLVNEYDRSARGGSWKILAWFDEHVGDYDVVIHTSWFDGLAYQTTTRNELDCYVLEELEPTRDTPLELDLASGHVRFLGRPPYARVWVLTKLPFPPNDHRVRCLGDFRLVDVTEFVKPPEGRTEHHPPRK